MRKVLLSPVLLACLPAASVPIYGQAPAPSTAQTSVATYADEAAVVERAETLYDFRADGTGSRTETTVIKIQSGAALQAFAVLSFPYASANQEMTVLYARVRKPDGTVISTPPGDAQDQPQQSTQLAPMYSDLRLKQLPLRSLAIGDTLEYQIKMTQKQAEVPGEFWGAESFGAGLVFLDRRVELRVPKSKTVTVYSPTNPPEVVESGEERIYRWKGGQLRRSASKEEAGGEEQDKKSPISWTTFPSWQAVGSWYQGLLAGRDAVTPAIQSKADELTAGAKTETEAIRALYEYVSQRTHYVAVAFGVGRYQPHTAAEVLANQYGDCKDKHTLLAALLRAKKIQVSAALIGGANTEFNEKVPSPAAFDHLITLVNADTGPVWLDSTSEVAPFRVLLPTLRDKQALVVPASSEKEIPHLAKTPADLPFPAIVRYEGDFQLSKDGRTNGKATVTLRGDDELIMRYTTRQIARGQWDELGQAYVSNSGFNGKADSVDIKSEFSDPWTMQYRYAQDPWSQWQEYQTGSLLPNVVLPVIDEKNPPKQEIALGGRHTQTARSTVHLPAGWSADLPSAIHLKTDFATFDETYQLSAGSLVSEFTLEVLKPKVEAAEWKSVKAFADALTQPWIQVTSRELVSGEKGPPMAGENNVAAAELVRETHEAIMAKDFVQAQKTSDQIIALNDKQAYAWSQRGWLAWQRQDLSEAASDYERELRQHPSEIDQYPDLIRLEGLTGRLSEQRTYLLAYAKLAPDNPEAILLVGSQLLRGGHVDDAIEVYRTAALRLPENRLLQIRLGSALLRAGQKDEGVTILKKALEGSSDPDVLNDGAYALLNTGDSDSLPLLEMSAQKAAEILQVKLAETPLEDSNEEAFRRARLLLATWDTLGWVYFNEGKDRLAEQYVLASWTNTARAEEGLHLGEILERKGDLVAAMAVYEMAMSQTRNSSSQVANDLRGRVEGLRAKGIAAQSARPTSALQEKRTFHVKRPSGVSGSGIFAVQVSAARTEKVAMMSGDEKLRTFIEPLKQLDLKLAIPEQSHALLLRSGVLFCSTEATCEFVLTPPESANVK